LELTDSLKSLFIDTARTLKGSARRLFMARTVAELGPGGQRLAQRELGWNRETIRKGMHELRSGILCCDAFALRGCKPAEDRLPDLLADIKALVDGQSQTDPPFRNNRLYTRLTAAEVRRQLIEQKGYTEAQLPQAETIGNKLNGLGYHLKKVKKSLPKKRERRPMPSLTNSVRSTQKPMRRRPFCVFP
jgi:Rhodopirellula transposase DDE domain